MSRFEPIVRWWSATPRARSQFAPRPASRVWRFRETSGSSTPPGSIGSNGGALVRRCRGILFRVTDAVAFRLFELVLEGRPDGAQVSGTIV
jgi:hypothetical protein